MKSHDIPGNPMKSHQIPWNQHLLMGKPPLLTASIGAFPTAPVRAEILHAPRHLPKVSGKCSTWHESSDPPGSSVKLPKCWVTAIGMCRQYIWDETHDYMYMLHMYISIYIHTYNTYTTQGNWFANLPCKLPEVVTRSSTSDIERHSEWWTPAKFERGVQNYGDS